MPGPCPVVRTEIGSERPGGLGTYHGRTLRRVSAARGACACSGAKSHLRVCHEHNRPFACGDVCERQHVVVERSDPVAVTPHKIANLELQRSCRATMASQPSGWSPAREPRYSTQTHLRCGARAGVPQTTRCVATRQGVRGSAHSGARQRVAASADHACEGDCERHPAQPTCDSTRKRTGCHCQVQHPLPVGQTAARRCHAANPWGCSPRRRLQTSGSAQPTSCGSQVPAVRSYSREGNPASFATLRQRSAVSVGGPLPGRGTRAGSGQSCEPPPSLQSVRGAPTQQMAWRKADPHNSPCNVVDRVMLCVGSSPFNLKRALSATHHLLRLPGLAEVC